VTGGELRLPNLQWKIAAMLLGLDPQALEWLRGTSEWHMTRINDILVNLMKAGERPAGQRVSESANTDPIGASMGAPTI
jgi:hypothetical protein